MGQGGMAQSCRSVAWLRPETARHREAWPSPTGGWEHGLDPQEEVWGGNGLALNQLHRGKGRWSDLDLAVQGGKSEPGHRKVRAWDFSSREEWQF